MQRADHRIDLAHMVPGFAPQRLLTAGAEERGGLTLEVGRLGQQRGSQAVQFFHNGHFQVAQTGSRSERQPMQPLLSGRQPSGEALRRGRRKIIIVFI